jgi:hypothetical protein
MVTLQLIEVALPSRPIKDIKSHKNSSVGRISFALDYWLRSSGRMSNVPLSQTAFLRKTKVFGYGNFSVIYPHNKLNQFILLSF